MYDQEFQKLSALVERSVEVKQGNLEILDSETFRRNAHKLVETSALGSGIEQVLARFLVRGAALELGIIPASIHDLYMARGDGKTPTDFTVPAINLRVLPFDAASVIFRIAKRIEAGAFIFEIARSEIGYTDQRPSEYATNILGAAIQEGYVGPVFLQGDHFQISASRYANDPKSELGTVKQITEEALQAGFYNIDVDTSTLVDLQYETIPEQQKVNTELSAQLTAFIRQLEPKDVTVSVGGEIGEVGGQNSTEEELRAYMDGFIVDLEKIDPEMVGLSKISIQTGTSHGGVVLPDGSIQEVSVDFDALLKLSQIARQDYKTGGAVQHGASTLPQEAFGKFVESEACEVHLATNFQNIFYNHAPKSLEAKIHAYLDENHQNERKEGQTDEQFYYKTRKRAIGPFKKEIWALPAEIKSEINTSWEKQFSQLFDLLGISGTKKYVDQFTPVPKIMPDLQTYAKLAKGSGETEDTSDLAD
ncbi:class II fructose-bisphosphate aldolase [Chloroflexota bacterium]